VSAPAGRKSAWSRVVQLLALGLLVAMYLVISHLQPAPEGGGVLVAATGLLLLCGLLGAELLEPLKLPHLTGYIAAGMLLGPHLLHFIDHRTVKQLELVNTLALALIALAGGLELRIADVRAVLRGLWISSAVQTPAVFLSQAALFYALTGLMPFTQRLGVPALLGSAALWGVLAVSRSPSATLAILSQTRARGPLARFSLAFVMSSDVLVLVLMALTIALVRPLVEPGGGGASSAELYAVGHELLGSVSVGTTLGLLLIAYMRLVGSLVLVLLVAIGFALSELLRYLSVEPMLTFLTAGFVVQNLSAQGDKLLHVIEETGSVVFVVFFATAGAHLDLPLLQRMWPVALALCAGRLLTTFLAQRASGRLTGDPPLLRRWGFASMISQAGLTLGLSAVMVRTFPSIGEGVRSLVIATVAINEVVGPIFFKLALERAGEVRGSDAA
jgi:Kef-type K+ transport system membrane component KefB